MGALIRRPELYYRTFSLPKGKGKRIIHAPQVSLKVIQKWFGFHLSNELSFDECVFGFVKGRSAVQGAAVHCSARWIYSVDIKDFFPTTPTLKVVEGLKRLGYPEHGAGIIGKICSYQGFLSQGSPASPVLSNLAFIDAEKELNTLAQTHGLRYTRYADDMVFSGQSDFPNEIKGKVCSIIESHGWRVSKKKEKFIDHLNQLKVYGLLVQGIVPRLPKVYRNKLRTFKYLLGKGKIKEQDISRVQGHLAYAKSINNL